MPLRSGASQLPTSTYWRPRPEQARGDRPVILSLQSTLVEAQAHSRLAMLRQAFVGTGSSRPWHPRYRAAGSLLCTSISIFGGRPSSRPGTRMLAAPLFTSALDTSGNAKQEGSP
jgi:hypothetical protein